MDRIIIDKLVVFAHHGVFPEEGKLGQRFEVSAVLYTDTRRAGIADNLSASIDYGSVCVEITKYLQNNTFQLLEAAAEQLAEYLLLIYSQLESIELRIDKPWAPVGLPLSSVGVSIRRGWHIAYIALGSNLGDKRAFLESAVTWLDSREQIQIEKVSDFILTKPYGGVEQDDFLNGCMKIRTLYPPHELLDVLHQAEKKAGRQRTVRWGPRTLDLDILFYDDALIAEDDLIIPHPGIPLREFVLRPMVQIAPYFVHPLYRKTITQLLEELNHK